MPEEAAEEAATVARGAVQQPAVGDSTAPSTHVRFFAVDGSTFLDGDYLIKGVSGRILWSLLGHYDQERRVDFTNREVLIARDHDLPAPSRRHPRP